MPSCWHWSCVDRWCSVLPGCWRSPAHPPDWCIALLRVIPALVNAGSALTKARVPGDSQIASLMPIAERGVPPLPDGLIQSIQQIYGVCTGWASALGVKVSRAIYNRHLLKMQLKYRLRSSASKAIKSLRGGAHRAIRHGNYHRHHVPSKKAWQDAGRGDGRFLDDAPAIQMQPPDHRKTKSYGNTAESVVFREKQAELIKAGRWKEAQQMDIDDIRSRFGDKYDAAILEALEYSDSFVVP